MSSTASEFTLPPSDASASTSSSGSETSRDPVCINKTVILNSGASNSEGSSRPSHWSKPNGTEFKNPWKSFNEEATVWYRSVDFLLRTWKVTYAPEELKHALGPTKPHWDYTEDEWSKNHNMLKATWLSHACFLVELPAPLNAKRGPRILFDPVFGQYCFEGIGMKFSSTREKCVRKSELPAEIEELPTIDMILISHNHFDHLDTDSLKRLTRLGGSGKNSIPIRIVLPLNNEQFLPSDRGNCVIDSMDWWQKLVVNVSLPSRTDDETLPMSFEVTCTPSQHQSGRSVLDRNDGLWCSWVVSSIDAGKPAALDIQQTPQSLDENRAFSCFFAGDTGYGYVRDTRKEAVPEFSCPVFEELGRQFDGFDLALIPIGAYNPRNFTSAMHSSPEDAVRIFQDIRASSALAMHWGTFALTNEPMLEPKFRLELACKNAKITTFNTCLLGQTTMIETNTPRPKARTEKEKKKDYDDYIEWCKLSPPLSEDIVYFNQKGEEIKEKGQEKCKKRSKSPCTERSKSRSASPPQHGEKCDDKATSNLAQLGLGRRSGSPAFIGVDDGDPSHSTSKA